MLGFYHLLSQHIYKLGCKNQSPKALSEETQTLTNYYRHTINMDCIYIVFLLKALYSIASHHASVRQGNNQHVRSS